MFVGDFDNLLQWPFPIGFQVSIRDQFYHLNTRIQTIQPEDRDPAFRRPTKSSKERVSTVIINTFIQHIKPLNETEGVLVEGTSFLEIWFADMLGHQTQTSLLFPQPKSPNRFHCLLRMMSCRITINANH